MTLDFFFLGKNSLVVFVVFFIMICSRKSQTLGAPGKPMV
jgi:hypothetical protein